MIIWGLEQVQLNSRIFTIIFIIPTLDHVIQIKHIIRMYFRVAPKLIVYRRDQKFLKKKIFKNPRRVNIVFPYYNNYRLFHHLSYRWIFAKAGVHSVNSNTSFRH